MFADERARQLLEEIRRRAENAELARIEAEELKLALETPTPLLPSTDSSAPALDVLHGSEVTDLRDELAQALVNNDLERASALHGELAALLPDDPVVDQFGAEIDRLKESAAQKHLRAARLAEERSQIATLLSEATEAYQREQYDEATQKITTLLTLDPENPTALQLRRDVGKAKELAERLVAEENRRRLEEQQQPIPGVQPSLPINTPPTAQQIERVTPPPSPPTDAHDSDSPIPTTVVSMAGSFLARHKLSVVLAGVLVFLGLQTASVIYHHLRNTVFRERASLLIIPVGYVNDQNTSDDLTIGLADDLASRLSQLRDVDVFATATSLHRHKSDIDGTRLAQEIGAEYVLTLSTLAGNDSVHVQFSLRELSQGRIAAENTYALRRNRLAVVRNEAIPALTRAMGIQSDEPQTALAKYTPLGRTYESYLLARALIQRQEPATLDSAMRVLQDAIGQDSLFAAAQILWGQARVLVYEASRDTSPSLLQQAHANLQRGIGLGARGSDVYTLWGMIEYYNAQYHGAIERLTQAVDMAPSDAEAQRRLALALLRVGRTEQALEAARQAVLHDPRNPVSHAMLGNLSLLIGDAQTALQALQVEWSLKPVEERSYTDAYVAALVANDQREQALDVVKQRLLTESDTIAALYNLGRMYQLAGKPKSLWDEAFGRARRLVQQHLKARPQDPRLYSYLSLIETRMGNFKEGMVASSRAVALAPESYETLYYAARAAVLQSGPAPEAYALLAKAMYRRFSLQQILDLDLLTLRSDQNFVRKITQ